MIEIDDELDAQLRDTLHALVPRLVEQPRQASGSGERVRLNWQRSRWLVAAVLVAALGGVAAMQRVDRSLVPADSQPAVGPEAPVSAPTSVVWVPVAVPEFDLTGYSPIGVFPDGEVGFWNGPEPHEVVPEPRDVRLVFYDRTNDRWRRSAPLPEDRRFEGTIRLEAGKVVALENPSTGSGWRVLIYTPETDSWDQSPWSHGTNPGGIAFDGESVAVLALPPGASPGLLSVARWSPGQTEWIPGAPVPLSARFNASVGSGAGRLVVLGGLTETAGPNTIGFPTRLPGDEPATSGFAASLPFAETDGASYDVATDRWTAVPRSPLRGVGAQVLVTEAGFVAVGGWAAANTSGYSRQVATYNTADGWRLLVGDTSGSRLGQITWNGNGRPVFDAFTLTGTRLVLKRPYRAWEIVSASGKPAWAIPALDNGALVQAVPDGGAMRVSVSGAGWTVTAPPTPWRTSEAGLGAEAIDLHDAVMFVTNTGEQTPYLLTLDW